MNLRDMQRQILAAIRTGTPSVVLQRDIVNGRGLDPQRCLEIHRQTWLGARMEVLKSAFPVCQQIVGTGCFRRLCKDYALACPSMHPNLHCFPEGFAAWLEDWIPDQPEFADYAYLPDLARLEWARYRIWEMGSDSGIDFTAFSALNTSQQAKVRFRLDESTSLVESPYPIHEIWQLHQTNKLESSIAANELPEYLLVYRTPSDPGIEHLNEHAAALYRQLQQGASLDRLQAVADIYNFALDAFIGDLITLGCIAGFQLSDNPVDTEQGNP